MPETIISQFQRAFNSPIEIYRQVATPTERDNIPSGVRWTGMLVYVVSDGVTYSLSGGGIDNGSWQELGGLQDAPSDGQTYGRKDGDWELIPNGGVDWGDIGGTLANQSDLQNELNNKANSSSVVIKNVANTMTSDFSMLHSSGNGYVSDNDTRTTELRGGETGVSRVRQYVASDLWAVDFESNGVGLDYSLHESGTPTDSTDLITKGYADSNYFSSGTNGSFTTSDAKTVTVVNGIITSIV